MRIISKATLRAFWERYPQAKTPLSDWFHAVQKQTWTGPADIKSAFGSADFLADNRVIFNVGGNKYRLIAYVDYRFNSVFIKFVGTHAEYDKIDALRVGR